MRAISLLDAHPKMSVANMLHSEKSTRHAHKFAADKAEHGCPSGENRCKMAAAAANHPDVAPIVLLVTPGV